MVTPKRTTSEPVEGTTGSTRCLVGLEGRREGRERPVRQARPSTNTDTSNSRWSKRPRQRPGRIERPTPTCTGTCEWSLGLGPGGEEPHHGGCATHSGLCRCPSLRPGVKASQWPSDTTVKPPPRGVGNRAKEHCARPLWKLSL